MQLPPCVVQADEWVVRCLNAAAHRWPITRRLVSAAAGSLASGEVLLMLAVAARGRPGAAARMLAAVGGIYAVSEVAGRLLPRPRPFAQVRDVTAVLQHQAERSFPSRHVASAVAMARIGTHADPHLGHWMSWLAAWLAVSRVGAGLHYPSDVLAGAGLGWLVGRLLR